MHSKQLAQQLSGCNLSMHLLPIPWLDDMPPCVAILQHKGNPNVIQQLQHQLDRLLHKDNADAGQT